MNKIASLGSKSYSIDHFVNIYSNHPRPVLFWDTCALLDIIRFLTRIETIDNPQVYKNISTIYSKVKWGKIYSVASTVNSKEWDDHVDDAISLLDKNLPKIINCSKMIVEAHNNINHVADSMPIINPKSVKDHILDMARTIVKKTIFLEVDKEVAFNALERITNKRPPSNAAKNSKAEFKDCAIWETMLELSRKINSTGIQKTKLFFTTNIDDFCTKNTGFPFASLLITEATTLNFVCCKSMQEVSTILHNAIIL